VLPEGLDLEHFSPAPEPRQRPAGAPLRVISVSRLERAKGVEDLVIAAGLLARRGVPVEVTILGAGPLEAQLRGVAETMGVADRLDLGGHVPWAGLPDAYRAHDVFVLASAPTVNWREQFGYAVIEAMACGLPALVGASGSLPEVVGREDLLVRPHDPIHLADRLAALAADDEARAALGAAMRERAVERFDVRDIRRRLREIYGDVLERTARRAA
jgi:2-deoxystreptamine N-acetyl-D-glucosaminyltransferase/2-deoxystreptamine glucosyltransferase